MKVERFCDYATAAARAETRSLVEVEESIVCSLSPKRKSQKRFWSLLGVFRASGTAAPFLGLKVTGLHQPLLTR